MRNYVLKINPRDHKRLYGHLARKMEALRRCKCKRTNVEENMEEKLVSRIKDATRNIIPGNILKYDT